MNADAQIDTFEVVYRGSITAITCGSPSGVVENAHGYCGKKMLDEKSLSE